MGSKKSKPSLISYVLSLMPQAPSLPTPVSEAPAADSNRAIVSPMPAPRDIAFDVVKGISILEVMIHHSTSHSARKYTVEGSFEWWSLILINRILHFAVPVFIFISALLLARSLVKADRPNWRRFALRRASRSLWPYLLWTVAYVFFRALIIKTGSDMVTYTWNLPLIGEVSGPMVLLDPREWVRNILWGRGYFHLYFMSILLQLSIAFPLVLLAAKKIKTFGHSVIAAALAQFAVYLLQKYWWGFANPGSLILWYLPPVVIGAWAGAHWDQFKEAVNKNWWPIVSFAALGGVAYVFISIEILLGHPVNTMLYNLAISCYTMGMALILVAKAKQLASLRIGPTLAKFGRISLVLFLIHPMLLYLSGGPRLSGLLSKLPLAPVWAFAILLTVSVLAAKFIIWLKADLVLFGQKFQTSLANARTTPQAQNA
mgnify:CR=1 FL=1